jgi:hypothetical protein
MANPPPYDNITGISRAAMKDNAQESLANYNGNARPGELVVDQATTILYIGNALGQLTAVGTAGATTWALLNDKNNASGPASIALGTNAGTSQGNTAIAIGYGTAYSGQSANAIALGFAAGYGNQQANAIAIGTAAGYTTQGISSVAIGARAGLTSQGNQSVAIGENAGVIQGSTAVAIGQNAGGGVALQGDDAVAIGHGAGENTQGTQAVAIGLYTGQNSQGVFSVAVGRQAGQTSQANNSIILNATGSALNQTTANTFTVKPVRAVTSVTFAAPTAGSIPVGFSPVYYNPTTGELIVITP